MNLTELRAFIGRLEERDRNRWREYINDAEYSLKPNLAHIKLGDHDIDLVAHSIRCSGDERIVQVVFKVDDALFAIEGYYSSYEGTTWDDPSQIYAVTPAQKTVTLYQRTP